MRFHRPFRLPFAEVISLLALLASPASSEAWAASGNDPLAGQRANALPITAFYTAPKPLPAVPPGTLIRSEPGKTYRLPAGVTATRIAYLSRSASDEPVMTTAVVLVPYGDSPKGGWPVIAWAHGTAGVARGCAPSLMKDLYYEWEGLFEYPLLGYAVVATDYAGLGSEGPHQYMSIAAQAHDVIYSIPAARAAVPALGARWVAVGHSQGGAAVLEVSALVRQTPDPGFLGTVSLAPPTDLFAMWHESTDANSAATGYLGIIALGIKAADPSFDVKDMLGQATLAKLPLIRDEACLDAAGGLLADAPADQLLVKGWADNPAVVRFARSNRPDQAPGYGPIYLLQGAADETIPARFTRKAAANLCRQGDVVEYKAYPGLDHDPLVYGSLRDQIAWIAARFAGAPARSTCKEG